MTGLDTSDSSVFLLSLNEGISILGIDLDDTLHERFQAFARVVSDTTKTLNLTSITDPREVAIKHFADSLSLLKVEIPTDARLIDVGTGGGFPGIPIAIARPDLQVTLLDATQKKVRFLEDAVSQLGLANCVAVVGRAEELAHDPAFREQFDVAVWRGLGSLAQSAELCMPYVKLGGVGIAMKGPKLTEELAPARPVIGQLGGKIDRSLEVTLPGDLHHRLLIIRKSKPTAPRFPRPWSKIKG